MNLAHATPSRPRARALALRAEATTAREALEVSDVDRAGFDHLCQRLHDTELAATTAERVAEEHPKRREHEAAARVGQARAEAISGTSVVVSEDRATVTRMAHCERCQRMAELLGDPTRLWERGWASRRETDTPGWPRLWFCPDCWKVEAPRLLRAGPPLLIPPVRLGGVIEVSRMRAHAKKRLRLQEQIRQLLVVDPDLGEALLRTVVYAAESKHAARQWRRLLPQARAEGGPDAVPASPPRLEGGPDAVPPSGGAPPAAVPASLCGPEGGPDAVPTSPPRLEGGPDAVPPSGGAAPAAVPASLCGPEGGPDAVPTSPPRLEGGPDAVPPSGGAAPAAVPASLCGPEGGPDAVPASPPRLEGGPDAVPPSGGAAPAAVPASLCGPEGGPEGVPSPGGAAPAAVPASLCGLEGGPDVVPASPAKPFDNTFASKLVVLTEQGPNLDLGGDGLLGQMRRRSKAPRGPS